MTLNHDLQDVIEWLHQSAPGLTGALVASKDGLPIAHRLRDGDSTRMAAMVATALGLGRRICETVGGGEFTETMVAGTDQNIFIYAAGPTGVLAVLAAPDTNVGLVQLTARAAARKVSDVLGAAA